MCGRFTQAYTWQKLVALYRLTVPALAALEGIAERRLVGHGLGAGVEGRRHFHGGLFPPIGRTSPSAPDPRSRCRTLSQADLVARIGRSGAADLAASCPHHIS